MAPPKKVVELICKVFKDFNGHKKVVAGLADSTPGSRAWPSRNASNDRKTGVRIDYGEKFEKNGKSFRNLVLQPNKEAENKYLKDLAAADSHQSLTRIAIPVQDPPDEDELLSMFKEGIEEEDSG